MDGQNRRKHGRLKDDYRLCRATLDDVSGDSVELAVIDMGAGGAALCDAQDSSRTPRGSNGSLTQGRVKMCVPSPAKRNANRTVKVGSYHVVREWPTGPGDDAGIAVRFDKVRSEWKKLLDSKSFAHALTDTARA